MNLFVDYSWCCGLLQFVYALVAFFIVNQLGGNAVGQGYILLGIAVEDETYPFFNLLYKTIAPVVCQIIFVAFCQFFEADSLLLLNYLIVWYYWVIRTIVIIGLGHWRLTNWVLHGVYVIVSCLLSFWIYKLASIELIFPSSESIVDQMWLIIIAFLYMVFNEMKIGRSHTEKRKEQYVIIQYNKFRKKYGQQIEAFWGENKQMEILTFAIMIYENFNRPWIVRQVERLVAYVKPGVYSTGIMQVQSECVLSDYESLCLGMQKLYRAWDKGKDTMRGYDLKNAILHDYNPDSDYFNEVYDIYEVINSRYYDYSEESDETPSGYICTEDIYFQCCSTYGKENVEFQTLPSDNEESGNREVITVKSGEKKMIIELS